MFDFLIAKFRYIKSSVRNTYLRRIFKNSGILLISEIIASFIGLISFAISGRTLGLKMFGLLMIIDTYVHLIDKLVNFQSWQAVITYGADSLKKENMHDFKSLIKFGFLVDLTTALLGFLIAIMVAPFFGRWQGWDDKTIFYSLIFSCVILFDISGVPTGILRLFNEFKLLAFQKVIGSIFKLIGVCWAMLSGAEFISFLFVWVITEILGYFLLFFMSWKALKKMHIGGMLSHPIGDIPRKYPGLIGFIISTNVSGTLKLGLREFDILLVGKLLGLPAVALYKAAKKFSNFLTAIINPLYQSIYPEFATLWAKKDVKSFKHLAVQIGFFAGLGSMTIWILFVMFGKSFIWVTMGEAFIGSYPISVVYMFSQVVAIIFLPLSPMILSMGKASSNLFAHFVGLIIYFPLLMFFTYSYGLNGAGFANIVFFCVWAVILLVLIRKYIRLSLNLSMSESA